MVAMSSFQEQHLMDKNVAMLPFAIGQVELAAAAGQARLDGARAVH
jgi:hypothetical protein